MALKATLDTLEGVPEALHSEYQQRDGKYHLTVEGMVQKGRLDEFRESNIALKRERDELTAKFDGVDPEQYREFASQAAKVKEKKLIEAGKVDELVAERVNVMRTEHDKILKSLTEEKTRITAQLEGLVIDGAIRDAASKSGARPEAIDDFLYRGRNLFRLQDGKAVPFDRDQPIYGKNGGPMEISEWVSTLTEKAPHLFVASQGGNSRAATPSRAGGGVSRDDASAFLANLDGIAKGTVKVA